MKRTQVYIPDDLFRRVQMLSRQTGKNQSELIREGLWIVVKQFDTKRKNNKKSIMQLAGAFSCPDADPNAAAKHNEIYDLLPWDDGYYPDE